MSILVGMVLFLFDACTNDILSSHMSNINITYLLITCGFYNILYKKSKRISLKSVTLCSELEYNGCVKAKIENLSLCTECTVSTMK